MVKKLEQYYEALHYIKEIEIQKMLKIKENNTFLKKTKFSV